MSMSLIQTHFHPLKYNTVVKN